jgi:uroporphyrin-III C-methyltransferase
VGKITLVGAGPGDPELLTLKALRALKNADVVLHDELIGEEILAFIPRIAKVHNVGKRGGRASTPQHEINTLLVHYASLGLQVVRLKGGDPLVFGRGGEEIEAVRQAKIEVEIVPGITAAVGAASRAQIPLTHRNVSSALMLLTSHRSRKEDQNAWPSRLPENTTFVVYMPGFEYEFISRKLIGCGVSPATPVAVISQATTKEEKVHCTTVEGLPQAPHLAAPTLLVVGEVVRFADHASLREEYAWLGPEQSTSFVPLFNQGNFSGDQE